MSRQQYLKYWIIFTLVIAGAGQLHSEDGPKPDGNRSSSAYVVDYVGCFTSFKAQDGTLMVKIRSFSWEGERRYLIVDAETLETKVASDRELRGISATPAESVRSSRYGRALEASVSAPFSLENDGVTRSETASGCFLTIDLCQSRRPFEKDLFEKLIAIHPLPPAPVALCVTGRWMSERPHEFRWLVQQVKEGRLNATWVNHSWSHPYRPKVPYSENFLMSEGINFEREIFDVEIFLLERGLVPSVFFRFPGLVSSEALVRAAAGHGLIVVGADAWLALGQKPKAGSVILVHGNGNEPEGVSILLDMITDPGFGLDPQPLADLFPPGQVRSPSGKKATRR
jgi:hypothetical protein